VTGAVHILPIAMIKTVGAFVLRFAGVLAGAKLLKSIYSTTPKPDDGPTFVFYWRNNAREALWGATALMLIYYILRGGPVTIDGFGALAGAALLLLFVTGETILGHKDETLDAIESMPGPFLLKILVGIGAFLGTAAVSAYYVVYALRAEW